MRTLLFLLLAGTCVSACNPTEAEIADVETLQEPIVEMPEAQPDSLLRHAVLFNLDPENEPEGARIVEAAFAALPAQIPEIHDFEWGTNNSPEGLNKGLTHMFFVTFKSEADRDAYLPHPAHKAFVETAGPYIKDVTVLDYWVQP